MSILFKDYLEISVIVFFAFAFLFVLLFIVLNASFVNSFIFSIAIALLTLAITLDNAKLDARIRSFEDSQKKTAFKYYDEPLVDERTKEIEPKLI